MAKTSKKAVKPTQNKRAGIPVTARKILKDGKLSKKELKFASISEAARELWEKNPKAAARNICDASLGEAKNRNSAYGYVFSRD